MDNIKAIFFDVGDTLAIRVPDPELQAQSKDRLVAILGTSEPVQDLLEQLDLKHKAYIRWRQETRIEISELQLWNKWLLPGRQVVQTLAAAQELTLVWRSCSGRRVLRPDACHTIYELMNRGYHLGIISNTISGIETPALLKESQLTDLFSPVILSCIFGRRKPDPGMFWEATRQAGIQPQNCAYIGDRPSRDVAGAKSAGFAMTGIIDDSASGFHESNDHPSLEPDFFIHNLSELVNFFPPRILTRHEQARLYS